MEASSQATTHKETQTSKSNGEVPSIPLVRKAKPQGKPDSPSPHITRTISLQSFISTTPAKISHFSYSRHSSSSTSPYTSTSSTHNDGKTLVCLHPKCPYETKRQYDMERHQVVHFGPKLKYDCPGRGCGRVGEHGFARKDHLTEHLRKVHAKPIPKTGKGGRGGSRSS